MLTRDWGKKRKKKNEKGGSSLLELNKGKV